MRIWVKTGDISRELSPYLDGDYVGVDEVREGLRDHDVRVDDSLEDEGRPQLWRRCCSQVTGCIRSKGQYRLRDGFHFQSLVSPGDNLIGVDYLIGVDDGYGTVGQDEPRAIGVGVL